MKKDEARIEKLQKQLDSCFVLELEDDDGAGELLRLARLGIWCKKYREPIVKSLQYIIYEYPETQHRLELEAIASLPKEESEG